MKAINHLNLSIIDVKIYLPIYTINQELFDVKKHIFNYKLYEKSYFCAYFSKTL